MSASRASLSPRQVSFSLFRGDIRLVEGTFTIMSQPGVSCFGANREIAIKGKKERVVIYEGVVFEHALNADGSAALNVRYYSTEPEPDSPIWFRQTVEVKAGLSMGSESGNEKLESVLLGDSHEFVFRSHALT